MATSFIQTRFDVGTESAELWRVFDNMLVYFLTPEHKFLIQKSYHR